MADDILTVSGAGTGIKLMSVLKVETWSLPCQLVLVSVLVISLICKVSLPLLEGKEITGVWKSTKGLRSTLPRTSAAFADMTLCLNIRIGLCGSSPFISKKILACPQLLVKELTVIILGQGSDWSQEWHSWVITPCLLCQRLLPSFQVTSGVFIYELASSQRTRSGEVSSGSALWGHRNSC